MMNPTDKPANYYNFVHPSRWAAKDGFKHRLGNFQCNGLGYRNSSVHPFKYMQVYPLPVIGVIHVPVADIVYKGKDLTAERVASYLSNTPTKSSGSIHMACDRDSYVIALPLDSVAYHCMNYNTNLISFGVEIAGENEGAKKKGLIPYNNQEWADYWKSPDAKLKLVQMFKGYIAMLKLVVKDEWQQYFIPLKKAVLDKEGKCDIAGWTQHREIPFYDAKSGKYNIIGNPALLEENQVKGQHIDISHAFPWEFFFSVGQEVIDEEIKREAIK